MFIKIMEKRCSYCNYIAFYGKNRYFAIIFVEVYIGKSFS